MFYRHLLLCASLSLLGACSGTMDDDITEIPCDDSHGCPNGLSCMENVCVGSDASIANDQVQATGRPVILTQHGRSAAVLLDVSVYEELLDELALLRDIKTAEGQVAKGRVAAHSTSARRLRAKIIK